MVIINLFKVLIAGMWVAGIFVTDPQTKALLWSMPAGYGGGTILFQLYAEFQERKKMMKFIKSSLHKGKPSPELEEKLQKIMKSIEELAEEDKKRKCTDPHCEDCWGLAN